MAWVQMVGLGCPIDSSGAMVRLGSPIGNSGVMIECGSSTGVSGATVRCGFSTGGSGIEVVGLGPSTCGCGVDVGLGCVSGVQEGLHTLTMVAV